MAADWTRASNLQIYSRPFGRPTLVLKGNGSIDAGCDFGSAAKGLAIDLEVAGSSPVSWHFSFPSLSYHVLFSSLHLLPWYTDHLQQKLRYPHDFHGHFVSIPLNMFE